MQETFEINAVTRSDEGKGASRRLRRTGMVPGIIYGGGKDPQLIATKHNELVHQLENEAFYSHILTVKVDGTAQKVVLKDLQRHPAKPFILHFDLLRVAAGARIKMHVPLHFLGEDVAPGVKAGGKVFHHLSDVEVVCEAQNLPEFIEVDVSGLDVGDAVQLSEIKLPAGVEIVALTHGDGHDEMVVNVLGKQAAVMPEEEEGEGEGEG